MVQNGVDFEMQLRSLARTRLVALLDGWSPVWAIVGLLVQRRRCHSQRSSSSTPVIP